MSKQHTAQRAGPAHNQAACPYLNQTGAQAVLNWDGVLAALAAAELPAELQAELRQLQLKPGAPDVSAAAR